jgi:negative regulator of flagellin synthesis FlgM
MTDAISNYGRRAQTDGALRSALDKSGKKAETPGTLGSPVDGLSNAAAPTSSKEIHSKHELALNKAIQRAKDEPDFDRAKVESIKQAIQQGQYPLNPRRIAESFLAIEQLIRD